VAVNAGVFPPPRSATPCREKVPTFDEISRTFVEKVSAQKISLPECGTIFAGKKFLQAIRLVVCFRTFFHVVQRPELFSTYFHFDPCIKGSENTLTKDAVNVKHRLHLFFMVDID